MNMAETKHLLRGTLKHDESMARHVSWRAGGVAARAYFPADLDDLRVFLTQMPADEPLMFVGLGSNLLVRDGGWRGTVVFTQHALKTIRVDTNADGDVIYAEAGIASPKVARLAAQQGYVGAEFLAGIPGTVGGALAMNAGCYGGETWNIVTEVITIDKHGELHTRKRDDYAIGYRHVAIKNESFREEWFVAARFKLASGDSAYAQATIKQLMERRMATQPLDQPNAGSVFRNPTNDHAARLIEASGLKGTKHRGAMISNKHANFIVNLGDAKASDIEALITLAQATVQQKFGIALEREVRIVGEAA